MCTHTALPAASLQGRRTDTTPLQLVSQLLLCATATSSASRSTGSDPAGLEAEDKMYQQYEQDRGNRNADQSTHGNLLSVDRAAFGLSTGAPSQLSRDRAQGRGELTSDIYYRWSGACQRLVAD